MFVRDIHLWYTLSDESEWFLFGAAWLALAASCDSGHHQAPERVPCRWSTGMRMAMAPEAPAPGHDVRVQVRSPWLRRPTGGTDMRRKIFSPASVLAVVTVLTLAGCGSGSDQTTSAGAAGTPPSSGAPATAATLPPSTTVASPVTTTAHCADVSFSYNPEDVAANITSATLSCTDADAVVMAVGPQLSAVDGPARVDSNGYTCTRTSLRSRDHGPPLATFDCANGPTKVSFTRALVS